MACSCNAKLPQCGAVELQAATSVLTAHVWLASWCKRTCISIMVVSELYVRLCDAADARRAAQQQRGPTFVRRGASFLSPHLLCTPPLLLLLAQAAQGRGRAAVCFRCRRCLPVAHRQTATGPVKGTPPPIRTPNAAIAAAMRELVFRITDGAAKVATCADAARCMCRRGSASGCSTWASPAPRAAAPSPHRCSQGGAHHHLRARLR